MMVHISSCFKIEEREIRKFRIQEPNDIDMVVATIKKEIPFADDPVKSAVFYH